MLPLLAHMSSSCIRKQHMQRQSDGHGRQHAAVEPEVQLSDLADVCLLCHGGRLGVALADMCLPELQ